MAIVYGGMGVESSDSWLLFGDVVCCVCLRGFEVKIDLSKRPQEGDAD